MKLLEKREIDKLKAIDRRKEIDEGIKLARKVDTLRELSAKEETNLLKFRDESIKKVKEEINILIAEKEALLNDPTLLKKEKVLSQVKVELENSFKKLNKEKRAVEELRRSILDKETNLIARESQIDISFKEFFDRNEKIKEKENLTQKYLSKAEIDYKLQQDTLLRVEESKRKFDEYQKKQTEVIEAKYRELALREKDIENQRNQNERDKADIEKDKLHIASQQETLAIAWKQLKKLQ